MIRTLEKLDIDHSTIKDPKQTLWFDYNSDASEFSNHDDLGENLSNNLYLSKNYRVSGLHINENRYKRFSLMHRATSTYLQRSISGKDILGLAKTGGGRWASKKFNTLTIRQSLKHVRYLKLWSTNYVL